MSRNVDHNIDQLLERIRVLELSNQQLKEDVDRLRQQVPTDTVKPTAKPSHYKVFFDRYQHPIAIRDFVYILTPGAFTHKSREGDIVGFDEYRDRVHILDTAGNPQERAPKNDKLLWKKAQH